MAQEIEIEYKNLLQKDEFNRLLYSLPFPDEAETQINYYFETPDVALKQLGCALRIREKHGIFTLTLKEPNETGLLETHDEIPVSTAEDWIDGNITETNHVTSMLAKKEIPIHELRCLGSLTTDRRELHYKDVLLVLDYSTYGNKSDYELEIEAKTEARGREMLEKLMGKLDIERRDTPNKIRRFFEEITK